MRKRADISLLGLVLTAGLLISGCRSAQLAIHNNAALLPAIGRLDDSLYSASITVATNTALQPLSTFKSASRPSHSPLQRAAFIGRHLNRVYPAASKSATHRILLTKLIRQPHRWQAMPEPRPVRCAPAPLGLLLVLLLGLLAGTAGLLAWAFGIGFWTTLGILAGATLLAILIG